MFSYRSTLLSTNYICIVTIKQRIEICICFIFMIVYALCRFNVQLLLPFRCFQMPRYNSRSGSLLWTIWSDMDNLWHRCVVWKRPMSNRSSCFHSTDASNRLEPEPKPSRVPSLTTFDLQDWSVQYVRHLPSRQRNSSTVCHISFCPIITSQVIFICIQISWHFKQQTFLWIN